MAPSSTPSPQKNVTAAKVIRDSSSFYSCIWPNCDIRKKNDVENQCKNTKVQADEEQQEQQW